MLIYAFKEFARREGIPTFASISAVIRIMALIIFIRRQFRSTIPQGMILKLAVTDSAVNRTTSAACFLVGNCVKGVETDSMERVYPKSFSVKNPAIEAICCDMRVWSYPQLYLGNFEQA